MNKSPSFRWGVQPACSRAPGDCYVFLSPQKRATHKAHSHRTFHWHLFVFHSSTFSSVAASHSLLFSFSFPIATTTSAFPSVAFDGLVRHSSFRTTHSLFLICRRLLTSFFFFPSYSLLDTTTLTFSSASQPSLVNWFPQLRIVSLHHIKKLLAHYPQHFTPSPNLIHNTGYPLSPWRVYCRDRLRVVFEHRRIASQFISVLLS